MEDKEPKQEQGQDVVEKFTQAIARGWCSKENSGKVGVWERIFFYYYR